MGEKNIRSRNLDEGVDWSSAETGEDVNSKEHVDILLECTNYTTDDVQKSANDVNRSSANLHGNGL